MSQPTESSRAKSGGTGVLLLAHGAPSRLEDVPEFLLNVRGGGKLPEPLVQEIAHRYAVIGGGSPLLELTRRQASALAERLGLPVHVGMRNWKPFIFEAVREMAREGLRRAVVICLAPQNSRTSVGLYRKHLQEAVEKGAPELRVDFIESWHDHPGLIAAFREKVLEALERVEREAGRAVPLIFTAHSVPERTISDGDPYARQARETARRVAEAIPRLRDRLTPYRLAYQSQGMVAEPWIGPTVESQIDELASMGERHVLLAPIGFVADHVEILYDIDVHFREYGQARGVRVARTESLNDSPLFIQALAALVASRLNATSGGPS